MPVGEELEVPFTVGEEGEPPTPPPVEAGLTPSSRKLYESSPSLFVDDESTGFFGEHLCDALTSMFQSVDEIVRGAAAGEVPVTGATGSANIGMPRHPGWSPIADPNVCPEQWLPWCSTLYGIIPPLNVSGAALRVLLKELRPQKRAGILSMEEAAIRANKPGFVTQFTEQAAGESYKIVAQTTPQQTAEEEAITLAAIKAEKPAGVQLVYTSSARVPWNAAIKRWNEVGGTVRWSSIKPGDV